MPGFGDAGPAVDEDDERALPRAGGEVEDGLGFIAVGDGVFLIRNG